MNNDEHIYIPNPLNDREANLRLISWWKPDIVNNAKVMVLGVGALGNEVIKNMALLSVGNLYIADMDIIEASNLSRSVLFYESNEGQPKVDVAAQRIKQINPQVKTRINTGDINLDIGLGVFRRMDVIIGCLDNRLARRSVNRACGKLQKSWIDGGILDLSGEVRLFHPSKGACYECTLTQDMIAQIGERYSCKGLAIGNISLGKMPTTPTISSIIAGIQSQEAIKALHNMDMNYGTVFVFRGICNDAYLSKMPVNNPDCESHDVYYEIVEMDDARAQNMTVRELWQRAKDLLGGDTILYLDRELVLSLTCCNCNTKDNNLKILEKVTREEATCPTCDEIKDAERTHIISGREDFLDMKLTDVGIPPLHIIEARNSEKSIFLELTGDQQQELTFY